MKRLIVIPILIRYVLGWTWSLGIATVFCLMCPVLGPRRLWRWLRPLWAKVTLALVGVQLNVSGAERLVGPVVFVSNHESLIDVVILPALLPSETLFVAKRTLRWIPFWGWAFAAGGALLIDRTNPRAALVALRASAREVPAAWSLAVFPEGTRSRTGTLGRFRRGAFVLARESQRPIVPIGLVGARSIVAAGGWLVRGGTVDVHVGPALPVEPFNSLPLRDHIAAGAHAVAAAVHAAGGPAPAQPVAPGHAADVRSA